MNQNISVVMYKNVWNWFVQISIQSRSKLHFVVKLLMTRQPITFLPPYPPYYYAMDY